MKLKIFKKNVIEFIETDRVHVYEDEIEYCIGDVSIREKGSDIESLFIDGEEIYNKSTNFNIFYLLPPGIFD